MNTKRKRPLPFATPCTWMFKLKSQVIHQPHRHRLRFACRKNAKGTADLTAQDVLSLCICRGGPEAVVETFVRGQSIWCSAQPELF